MFNHIRADILRFQRVDESSFLKLIINSPGLKTLMVYRLGRWLNNICSNPFRWPLVLFLTPVYWVLTAYMRITCDISLEQSADIGPGLYIGHFGGIRLRNCRLGSYCSIHQEVSLEPSVDSDKGPIVGNHVWIGAHARIIGPIQVNDGATVGAGAFVTQDIDARCLVLGNPARVMQRDYDNSSIL